MEKNANDIKKDKINGNININNNKKFSSIFKDEMKTFKNKINSFNPGFMPKTKQLNIKKTEQNFNSIIHENEFENLTNSSYDVVNTFKEKTKNEVKEEAKIGEEEEEETKSNIKKEEKSSSTFKKDEKTSSTFKKEEKSSSTFKKDDKTNSTIKKEEKTNSTIKEEKEEKSISGKEEDKKAPNNDSKNISKLVKGLNPSNEEKNINFFNMKENKISNTNNNRGINPPIYQMTSTNEGGMIRALSRKTIMRKKKSKTANKYDFLI